LLATLPAEARDHKLPPVRPAQSYAAVDVHAKEQVAIAAEPYDTKRMDSIFRVDYLKYGFMPVLLTITNMGNRPISLSHARILFQTASGGLIQAAEPEDVQRRMPQTGLDQSIPTPSPIPGIHFRHKNYYQKIKQDFNTFEYQSLVVNPHSTQAGFLFYDVSGIQDPLRGAHLYVSEIRNADGQDLFSFQVPFDKYLQAQSKQTH
jgi:hypothetical protein